MIRIRKTLLAAFVAAVAFAPVSTAAVTPAAGFQSAAVVAAPGGAFPGGLDALPNGNVALYDGVAIVEVDPASGAVVKTLHTPLTPVFGSFVKVDPTGSFLLFGESSFGTITRVPLDGAPSAVVATIAFNFDCAFDTVGAAYVAASPSFVTTQVYRVSLSAGTTDLVLDIGGPSGPIAFDATNALYYADADPMFPPAPGQQTIHRFSAAKLASATGPGHLTAADGTPFVAGVTSIADLVFDAQGDLLASDSVDGTVREYDAAGNPKSVVATEAPFSAVTTLAFAPGSGPAAFDRFQPELGGTLHTLSTDFFSFNHLNVVRPAPGSLATTPASPVPAGPVSLDVADGPALGAALLLVTSQPLASPVTVHAGTVPLLIGVDTGLLLGAALLPLDAQGAASLQAVHHGAPAQVAAQAILLDAGTAVGTTNPLTIRLL